MTQGYQEFVINFNNDTSRRLRVDDCYAGQQQALDDSLGQTFANFIANERVHIDSTTQSPQRDGTRHRMWAMIRHFIHLHILFPPTSIGLLYAIIECAAHVLSDPKYDILGRPSSDDPVGAHIPQSHEASAQIARYLRAPHLKTAPRRTRRTPHPISSTHAAARGRAAPRPAAPPPPPATQVAPTPAGPTPPENEARRPTWRREVVYPLQREGAFIGEEQGRAAFDNLRAYYRNVPNWSPAPEAGPSNASSKRRRDDEDEDEIAKERPAKRATPPRQSEASSQPEASPLPSHESVLATSPLESSSQPAASSSRRVRFSSEVPVPSISQPRPLAKGKVKGKGKGKSSQQAERSISLTSPFTTFMRYLIKGEDSAEGSGEGPSSQAIVDLRRNDSGSDAPDGDARPRARTRSKHSAESSSLKGKGRRFSPLG